MRVKARPLVRATVHRVPIGQDSPSSMLLQTETWSETTCGNIPYAAAGTHRTERHLFRPAIGDKRNGYACR